MDSGFGEKRANYHARSIKLSVRLIALVFAAIVPAIGVILYNGLSARSAAITSGKEQVAQYANEISAEEQRIASSTIQLLAALGQVPSVSELQTSQCNNLVEQVYQQLPAYANIAVADPKGNVVCSAIPLTNPVNVSDEPYFKYAVETKSHSNGDINIGKISGVRVITYSNPILDSQDNLVGVIYASVALGYLSTDLHVNLPNNSSVEILNSSGSILSTSLGNLTSIGQKAFSNNQRIIQMESYPSGTFTDTGSDGIKRLYGFKHINGDNGYIGIILIGIPIQPIEAQANDNLIRSLITMVIVALFAIAMAQLIGMRLLRYLQTQATTDSLTGIYNRKQVLELAEREFRRSVRNSVPMSISMIDLDNFKSVNDNYGHGNGDLVLKKVAEIADSLCRDTDLIGRYGGEEFLLVFPDTNAKEAAEIANRIREKIAETQIELRRYGPIRVTASFGVAQSDSSTATLEELLNNADKAMYMAKSHGKNQVNIYSQINNPDR